MEKVTRAHLAGLELFRDSMDKILPVHFALLLEDLIDQAKAAPDQCETGYMPIPTAEQLAEALENFGSFHDMSAELIAPELLANLLKSTTKAWESLLVGVPDGWKLVPMEITQEQNDAGLAVLVGGNVPLAKVCRAMLDAAPTVKAERFLPCGGWGTIAAEPGDPVTACDHCGKAPSLPAAGSAAEEVEIVEFDWPEYHCQGMGCGLEDRGITDRYEAMKYGWDCAIDRCAEITPDEPLMTVAQHERIVAALSALSARQSAPERVSDAAIQVLEKFVRVMPKHGWPTEYDDLRRLEIVADAARAILASHAEGGKV